MDRSPENPVLNPLSLTLADAARVLSRASGATITSAHLQADTNAGAPTNADGNLNLVHYAAWLVREVQLGD